MLDRLLQELDQRMVLALLVAIPCLTITASYLYLFKKPIARYAQSAETLQRLEQEAENDQPLSGDILQLQRDIERLNHRLSGNNPALATNEMVAYVIGRLDLIASDHAVQLVSVTPGKPTAVFMFEEIPFNIEVTGSYFSIFSRLHDIKVALGPMVVKQFELQRGADNERRMRLVMVSYRLQGARRA